MKKQVDGAYTKKSPQKACMKSGQKQDHTKVNQGQVHTKKGQQECMKSPLERGM